MTKTPAWRRYLTFWRSPVVQDVDDELRFHTNMRVKEYMARGMSEDDARRAVAERLGDVRSAKDECVELTHARERNARNAAFFDALRSDLRYAVRGLRAKPGFTAAVVITLALGIGANAAVFSVVDRLLFRAAPMLRDAARTHQVYVSYPMPNLEGTFNLEAIPYRRFLDLTASNVSFERTAAFGVGRSVVGAPGEERDMQIAGVSPNFFAFFDASPTLGRYFGAAEDVPPSGARVVVLSYAMWQTEFAGRAEALGAKVQIGAATYTVIGVAPRWFVGLWPDEPPVAFIPFSSYAGAFDIPGRGPWWKTYELNVAGMLVTRKPGVTIEMANADLTRGVRQQWSDESKAGPPQYQPHAFLASMFAERGPNQSSASKVAALVGGMALVVLLIAGANVANLLLARALRRRREVAVRLALGISRRRLMMQLLTETLLLAVVGGIAGLLAAHWAGPALRATFLSPSADTAVVTDTRTLMFVGAAIAIAGVLTGVAPAWQAGRLELTRYLRIGGREGMVQRSPARVALLVTQGALSVLLLVAAGLFVRSLNSVQRVRLGYDVDPILVVSVNMRGIRLDSARVSDLWRRLLDAARSAPGVERVALTQNIPFLRALVANVARPTDVDSAQFTKLPDIFFNAVTPDYFATMGTRVIRGRAIDSTDVASAPRVAVVGSRLAQTFWPGRDAIGQCLKMADRRCAYVVGIAEDIKNTRLGNDPGLYFYLAHSQTRARGPQLLVRLRGDASRSAEALRAALQREMPGASYVAVTPFEEIIGRETRSWHLGATMFAAFGALAMLLAAVGLYSAISYDVAQRTHEMGIRRALGAQVGDVIRLVVRQGLVVGGVGVLLGAVITFIVAPHVQPMLFEVSSRDPFVYTVVLATMLAVAVAASFIPARRAASVDPNVALRSE